MLVRKKSSLKKKKCVQLKYLATLETDMASIITLSMLTAD